MPVYLVEDTITLARSWRIVADSEDDAIERVLEDGTDYEEEQIDNTPYEATLLTKEGTRP